jgi:ATP-dependent DNA ligase
VNGMTSRSDGYIPPCIPTRAYKVPAGADWVHEIKHDGYRLQVRRDGDVFGYSSGRRQALIPIVRGSEKLSALGEG